MLNLNPLPFTKNSLEPHISERTIDFHYGKHHQAYLDNLNKLISGSDLENLSLEEIIKISAGDGEKIGIFNNAAQVYNHDFFWSSLSPVDSKSEISEELLLLINSSFGSLEKFKEDFKNVALTQFGSGWVWLVKDGEKLAILKTSNADTAILHEVKPLLVVDVWEHAYYLDYQNKRGDFVSVVLDNLINWEFVLSNLHA